MMKPKLIPVLEQCIDDGVQLGLNRAYKHNDNPDDDIIVHHIREAVMNNIYEWFDLEND